MIVAYESLSVSNLQKKRNHSNHKSGAPCLKKHNNINIFHRPSIRNEIVFD